MSAELPDCFGELELVVPLGELEFLLVGGEYWPEVEVSVLAGADGDVGVLVPAAEVGVIVATGVEVVVRPPPAETHQDVTTLYEEVSM